MLRVKDEPDLVRVHAGMIQNVNHDEYRSFIAKRRSVLDTKERLEKLERDSQDMNSKLDLILQLMKDGSK